MSGGLTRLLVDTHRLLWPAWKPERPSRTAMSFPADPGHDLAFSPASVGEIAIMRRAGHSHSHKDPFDRLLIARAIVEPTMSLTADTAAACAGPIALA